MIHSQSGHKIHSQTGQNDLFTKWTEDSTQTGQNDSYIHKLDRMICSQSEQKIHSQTGQNELFTKWT